MRRETPIGLALILCDSVIQDKSTNKFSLIGMFDRLIATSFPCVHPAMAIYISATSGRGEYDAQIICRHQATEKRIFTIGGKMRFADPMQVVELVCNVQRPKFEDSGEYWLELLIDEVPVMMRRLVFEERPPENDGQSN